LAVPITLAIRIYNSLYYRTSRELINFMSSEDVIALYTQVDGNAIPKTKIKVIR